MRYYLWVVEEKWCGKWIAWPDMAEATRKAARRLQKSRRREEGSIELRIRRYIRWTS